MPSERQLKANRRNAARGGPKTPEGRAAVRFHALKHGLSAATTVLPGEDPAALDKLRRDLSEDLQPANHKERYLFNDLVLCAWRLLRLRRVETEMWTEYILGVREAEGAARKEASSTG